jgi:hypothetical protein
MRARCGKAIPMREVCDLTGDCMIERTGTEWLLQLQLLCKLYENLSKGKEIITNAGAVNRLISDN